MNKLQDMEAKFMAINLSFGLQGEGSENADLIKYKASNGT